MNHKSYLEDPGIYKIGTNFFFHKNNEKIKDKNLLQTLSSYVVPPAWTNVWYASKKNCHIRVRGTDSGGKKQYILSDKWIQNSKYIKFQRMKKFMYDLSSFKRKIFLRESLLTREILIHLLFNLLIDLHIRVGNEVYAENNNTYGLTTLRQKHLKYKNGTFQLCFTGKSNIEHCINIPPEYNTWFNKLKSENKNKLLFVFENKPILSEELNDYLKKYMGKDYTCKDFRTYSANILFIKSFLKNSKNITKPKKCVLMSIDNSAKQLGHTRSISRKSYINESLIDYCIDSFEDASRSSCGELVSKVWPT